MRRRHDWMTRRSRAARWMQATVICLIALALAVLVDSVRPVHGPRDPNAPYLDIQDPTGLPLKERNKAGVPPPVADVNLVPTDEAPDTLPIVEIEDETIDKEQDDTDSLYNGGSRRHGDSLRNGEAKRHVDTMTRRRTRDDHDPPSVRSEPKPRPIMSSPTSLVEDEFVFSDDDRALRTPPNSMPLPPANEDEFMAWCTQVLGIQTMLEIQTFEYEDFMRIRMSQADDEDEFCDNDETDVVETFPTIPVRGLAATQDITPGDVVISIPFHAMITVPTTIDHDPVLSGILGPAARAKYGWDDVYFESPLLTVAILYHAHLGGVSPLHNYIQVLKSNSPVDSMPLTWDSKRLRNETTVGVRKIVRGIQKDIREIYDTVVQVLREDHPAIFDHDYYSYEEFQWAFALVNSRHWYLPIPDLDTVVPNTKPEESEYAYNEQVLPASQPTEEWVREQNEADKADNIAERESSSSSDVADSHSFLAPVADLLNFGPPCTQGRYNSEKKAFELVATCPFLKGQEVTFWYSNDCDDVMISNYGFTHPMVPRCLSADDWQHNSELWRRRAEALMTELEDAYKELGRMDVEIETMQTVLEKCNCDHKVPRTASPTASEEPPQEEPTKLRHWKQETAGVRGGAPTTTDESDHHQARHGIRRKKWQPTGKSDDIGL